MQLTDLRPAMMRLLADMDRPGGVVVLRLPGKGALLQTKELHLYPPCRLPGAAGS